MKRFLGSIVIVGILIFVQGTPFLGASNGWALDEGDPNGSNFEDLGRGGGGGSIPPQPLTNSNNQNISITILDVPQCVLSVASIVQDCGDDGCQEGEIIAMDGTLSGPDCVSLVDHFQIDAYADEACKIQYLNGTIQGLSAEGANLTVYPAEVHGLWTIPAVPASCQGKTLHATWAAVRNGGPPEIGTIVSETGNVSGNIYFSSANQPPALPTLTDPVYVDEGNGLIVGIEATDPQCPDGSCLTYSFTSDPSAASFCSIVPRPSGHQLECAPGYDKAGSYLMTVTVTDNGNPPLSDNGSYTMIVRNVNRAPVITPSIPNQVLDEGQTPVDIILTISDPDGDNIEVSSLSVEDIDPGDTPSPFITLTGSGNGSVINRTLHMAPGYNSSGVYNNLRVRASDTGTPAMVGYSNLFNVTVNNVAVCGNGMIEPPEQCDDGNMQSGDGCSSTCTFERVRLYDTGGTLVATFNFIQPAIDAASNGFRVEADPGTYVENIDFKGKNIRVHGMDPDNPQNTIIDGNGSVTSETVVKFITGENSNAILEGFKIMNGKSTVSSKGGGITITGTASPTIRNCIVTNNTTTSGQSGGGIHVQDTASPTINNTFITNNTALNGGGLMIRAGTNVTITNSTISGNTLSAGGVGGGGIFSFATFTITNSTISNNNASASGLDGGGIYLSGSNNTNSTLDHLIITGNVASASAGDGGGIYVYIASPTITNSFFANNTAAVGGGIRVLEAHPVTLRNCVFAKNSASSVGGAIYYNNAESTIINSTIADNTYPSTTGAIHYGNGGLTVANSIIWNNNQTYQIWQSGGTTYPVVSYSDLKPQSPAITGTAIKNVDPVFVDPATSDYHLGATSPAAIIDAADGNVDPVTDYDGSARYDDASVTNTGIGSPNYVDMGAFERQIMGRNIPIPGLDYCSQPEACPAANPGIVRVYNASNVQVGGDYNSIQAAIDAAATGYTVKVWPGTYIENVRISGKKINLIGVNGRDVTIIAGCNRTNPSDNSALKISGSSASNSLVDGFTVRNGDNRDDGGDGKGGGGIYVDAASATIQNVTVRDNYAVYGAGISAGKNTSGTTTVTVNNALITGNVAGKGGGGVSVYGEYVNFNMNNSQISYNCSDSETSDEPHHSGGFYLASRDNDGANSTHSKVVIIRTVIDNNTDWDVNGAEGGGIYDHDDDNELTLTNVTIVNNKLAGHAHPGAAGGIDFGYPDFTESNLNKLRINNTIIWNNDAYEFSSVNPITVGNIIFDYNAVQNITTEAPAGMTSSPHVGNISPSDIKFLNLLGGNYNLQAGSPAINSGDPLVTDPDGTRSDMGAFYYQESTAPLSGGSKNTRFTF